MAQQIGLPKSAQAPQSHEGAGTHIIAPGLAYCRVQIVNVVFIGTSDGWVLVDAGLPGTAGQIIGAAEALFGIGTAPRAILLTHGHFDHVGALKHLLEKWPVPVYAHPDERPFLTGERAYPPADHHNKGLMARLSPLFPRGPIDIRPHLRPLPANGSVPVISDWCWLHTPGHSPGHVSLWNSVSRQLVVGDAFITTAQESAYEVITQELEIHGPPRYFTPDWTAAEQSVKRLAVLGPELAISGHGRPIQGDALRTGLNLLAEGFRQIARPAHSASMDEPT